VRVEIERFSASDDRRCSLY